MCWGGKREGKRGKRRKRRKKKERGKKKIRGHPRYKLDQMRIQSQSYCFRGGEEWIGFGGLEPPLGAREQKGQPGWNPWLGIEGVNNKKKKNKNKKKVQEFSRSFFWENVVNFHNKKRLP